MCIYHTKHEHSARTKIIRGEQTKHVSMYNVIPTTCKRNTRHIASRPRPTTSKPSVEHICTRVQHNIASNYESKNVRQL